jgi:ABC-type dipeptide/oligopeptide/nickel transport system permease subunit
MASSTVAAMPIEPAAPLLAAPRRHNTVGWQIASGIRRNPAAIISLVVLGMVTIAAIFATSLPFTYDHQDIRQRNSPPSQEHLLGTDQLGRDVLSRLAYGARVSMTVAVAATLLTLVIGVVVGSIAGYAGGRIDALIMRFVDAMYAFPDLLFVILVSALVRGQLSGEVTGWLVVASVIDRASSGLFPVFLSLGLTSWLTTARLVRAQLLSLKHREYVQASRGAGARSGFILRKHLLPNTLAPLIVAATLAVPNAILLEAGLSFIGLGVQPPTPSWGIMISDGVASLRSFPHLMLIPALMIGLTLLAFNVLGDALRDAVDPLLQRSR